MVPTVFTSCLLVCRISRKDDPMRSNIAFMNTKLGKWISQGRMNDMLKWSSKFNIKVFEKKFIMIPINAQEHWSLCVVVNPGENEVGIKDKNSQSEGDSGVPCMLHLDSLPGLHKRDVIAKKVNNWLKAEWQRKSDSEGSSSYTDLPCYAPSGETTLVSLLLLFKRFFSDCARVSFCSVQPQHCIPPKNCRVYSIQFQVKTIHMIAAFLFAAMLTLYTSSVTRVLLIAMWVQYLLILRSLLVKAPSSNLGKVI